MTALPSVLQTPGLHARSDLVALSRRSSRAVKAALMACIVAACWLAVLLYRSSSNGWIGLSVTAVILTATSVVFCSQRVSALKRQIIAIDNRR